MPEHMLAEKKDETKATDIDSAPWTAKRLHHSFENADCLFTTCLEMLNNNNNNNKQKHKTVTLFINMGMNFLKKKNI